MFENEKIHGIYASRYIASWLNVGGDPKDLVKWLRCLTIDGEGLTEDEIHHIRYLAENGKLELEKNA